MYTTKTRARQWLSKIQAVKWFLCERHSKDEFSRGVRTACCYAETEPSFLLQN